MVVHITIPLCVLATREENMKVGDCPACYRGSMKFVKVVFHFDGKYKMYRCNNCKHVCEMKT
jgi:hypothetical protein